MSFDSVSIDTPEVTLRLKSRLLSQFKNSYVLNSVLEALGSEIQAFQEAVKKVIEERSPGQAYGEQLNALGRITGQSREIFDYAETSWWILDNDSNTLDKESVKVWVENGADLDVTYAGDEFYRRMIEGKISRNFAQYGSIPEIQEMFRLVYNEPIHFQRIGLMHVQLTLPLGIASEAVVFATRFVDRSVADNVPYLPYPETVSIDDTIIYTEIEPFGVDGYGYPPDFGYAA